MEVPPGAHTVSSTPIYPSLASLLPASLPPTPKRPADAAWVQPSGKKVKTLPSPTAEVEVSTPTESEVELMAARAPKSKSEKHSNSPQACPTERFAWLAKDYVKPPNADELKKLPTHKVALLMGYCGKEYTGMQLNRNVPSIELELFKALAGAGAVCTDDAMDPAKVSFVRASRTDKGVHAAGQVCSLKMITKDKEIVQKLNALLPPQIRIWGYVKVSKPFHAKNTCDSRIYEYLLPTYVLQPCSPVLYPRSGVGESARMTVAEEDGDAKSVAEDDYAKTVVNEDDTMTVVEENEHKVFDIPKMNAEELNRKRSYRAPAHQLEKLEMLLNQYAGFHNFHNFTNGMKFSDKKAMRLIKSFECSKPFIRDDLEWVSCKVHGQSFMLHQIRKMIGLVIMMMRTGTGVALIRQAFREERLNIPKAPSLGLLLEQVVYHKYGGTGPHSHIQRRPNSWEPVNFDKYKDEIEAFKEKWIYSGIAAEEAQDAVFNEWLRVIDSRPGDYAWYLNKDGSIHLDRRPKNMLGKGREGV